MAGLFVCDGGDDGHAGFAFGAGRPVEGPSDPDRFHPADHAQRICGRVASGIAGHGAGLFLSQLFFVAAVPLLPGRVRG